MSNMPDEFHSILQNMYVYLVYMNIYCIIKCVTQTDAICHKNIKESVFHYVSICCLSYKHMKELSPF